MAAPDSMRALRELVDERVPWLQTAGKHHDVAICSRVRLARNVEDEAFQRELTRKEQRDLIDTLLEAARECLDWSSGWQVDLQAVDSVERQFLLERRLISPEMSRADQPAAVLVEPLAQASVMLNEEDHVRLQVLRPGVRLPECLAEAIAVDRALEHRIDWATDERYGYLTSCPTNTGTGLRASVMLHLPALAEADELPLALRSLSKLHLTARGIQGEGSDATGHFYQISNQRTLGTTEEAIIDQLHEVVDQLIAYERMARESLLANHRAKIEDKVFRAWGLLGSARRLSSKEAIEQLSWIRLGHALGLIGDTDWRALDRIFIGAQPAHLQMDHPEARTAEARDELRAACVRRWLAASDDEASTN